MPSSRSRRPYWLPVVFGPMSLLAVVPTDMMVAEQKPSGSHLGFGRRKECGSAEFIECYAKRLIVIPPRTSQGLA